MCISAAHSGVYYPAAAAAMIGVNFLAERCNYIAKFGYCHKMLSVCRLRHVCVVTKHVQMASRGFHCKAAMVSADSERPR